MLTLPPPNKNKLASCFEKIVFLLFTRHLTTKPQTKIALLQVLVDRPDHSLHVSNSIGAPRRRCRWCRRWCCRWCCRWRRGRCCRRRKPVGSVTPRVGEAGRRRARHDVVGDHAKSAVAHFRIDPCDAANDRRSRHVRHKVHEKNPKDHIHREQKHHEHKLHPPDAGPHALKPSLHHPEPEDESPHDKQSGHGQARDAGMRCSGDLDHWFTSAARHFF